MTQHRAIHSCYRNEILPRPRRATIQDALADPQAIDGRETCDVEIDPREPTWHRCRWGHDVVFYPVGPEDAA